MQTRIMAWGIFLVAFCALPARADESDRALLRAHQIEPTLAGVTEYLRSLRSLEARQERQRQLVQKLIARLNDDDWRVRDSATQTLMLMPAPARPALERALSDDDLEISWRARQVLDSFRGSAYDFANDQGALLAAVCRVIREQPISGATATLLEVIPHLSEKYVLDEVRGALAATATPADVELLRAALASEDVETKTAAMIAFGRVSNESAALQPFLTNENLLVKAAAAHGLAQQGDRSVLPVLVELLSAEQARVRSEAVRVLRAVTGQNFEYTAYDAPANQQQAIQQWRQWVREHGTAAELKFPFTLEQDEFDAFRESVRVYCTSGNGHLYIHVEGQLMMAREGLFPVQRGISMLAMHQDAVLFGESFDTWQDRRQSDAFADAVAKLPEGAFVVLGILDEATDQFNENGQRAINAVGGSLSLFGARRYSAYYCIGYKGMPVGYAAEALDPRGGPARYPWVPRE